jgi:hypothetical protein
VDVGSQRRLVLRIAVVVCVVVVGVDGASRSPASGKGRGHRWMIIDGPGAITQIETQDDEVTVLPKGINHDSLTNKDTNGHIAKAEANCDAEHFHGTLRNEPDPHPQSCGWGRVKARQNTSELALNMSLAERFEIQARELLDQDPVRWGKAVDVCHEARRPIKEVRETVARARNKKALTDEQFREIDGWLLKAQDEDRKFFDAADDKNLEAAKAALELAISSKRHAVAAMPEFLIVPLR